MKEVRCSNCNRKLAEAEYIRLSIKCPRCGAINELKAIEPPRRAPGAQKERSDGSDFR
ncbi:MAG: Com family DNA-binding transcriptional regulator [Rhodocyclaceae bacterium]|nr:Com family DNA-binding transcriptional regulator [Rhodocyclaceae bacterium]